MFEHLNKYQIILIFILRCQSYGGTNQTYWAGPLVGCSNYFFNLVFRKQNKFM
jgi:hypothetical protein